jgi:hypothetical protein
MFLDSSVIAIHLGESARHLRRLGFIKEPAGNREEAEPMGSTFWISH